jgi:hypothetical protein
MEFFKTTMQFFARHGSVKSSIKALTSSLPLATINIVIVDINKMGLFLQVFTVLVITVSLQGWVPLGCLEEERIALLQLKDSLNYPNGTSLPSWMKADANCCSWELIECNSSTGRVTELGLGGVWNPELGDWYLNASLFLPFQQLNVLSLSNNRIAGWVEKKGLLS